MICDISLLSQWTFLSITTLEDGCPCSGAVVGGNFTT
jgi:hypothetical protein